MNGQFERRCTGRWPTGQRRLGEIIKYIANLLKIHLNILLGSNLLDES